MSYTGWPCYLINYSIHSAAWLSISATTVFPVIPNEMKNKINCRLIKKNWFDSVMTGIEPGVWGECNKRHHRDQLQVKRIVIIEY